MSNPNQNPFAEGSSCSVCPAGTSTAVDNDELFCCAAVIDGTCTACSTAVVSGCTAVACDANYGLVDVSSEEGLLFFLTHLFSSELSTAAVLNDILSLAV